MTLEEKHNKVNKKYASASKLFHKFSTLNFDVHCKLTTGKFMWKIHHNLHPDPIPCPSQKLGTPTQLKTTFPIDMEQGYPLKNVRLDKLKVIISIGNCKKTVFNYVFCKNPSKVMKTTG